MLVVGILMLLVWSPGGEQKTEDLSIEAQNSGAILEAEVVPETPPSGQEAIEKFYALTAEYNRTVEEERAAQSEGVRSRFERAHFVSFYTFCSLQNYYLGDLTSGDKAWIFANPDSNYVLPVGVVFDFCGPVVMDGSGFETSGPRESFDIFIEYSFREIDFQSALDIIEDEVAMKEVRQTVRARMDMLGVAYPYVLQQAEDLHTSEED